MNKSYIFGIPRVHRVLLWFWFPWAPPVLTLAEVKRRRGPLYECKSCTHPGVDAQALLDHLADGHDGGLLRRVAQPHADLVALVPHRDDGAVDVLAGVNCIKIGLPGKLILSKGKWSSESRILLKIHS